MHGHFQSPEKDGGQSNRSTISENPTLHINFMALCFIEPELFPIKVLNCRKRDFQPFLLLWPWPWPDDLHLQTWSVYPRDIPDVQIWTFYIKVFRSYHL